ASIRSSIGCPALLKTLLGLLQCQDKLAEARFFLRHLREEVAKPFSQEPAAFGHYLSDFISAARSVPWVLGSEETEKYAAWHATPEEGTYDRLARRLAFPLPDELVCTCA